MKYILSVLILSICLDAKGQGAETIIGGATDWYWKLMRTSADGALNLYSKRTASDVLRARFIETGDMGGMQLFGNLRIDGYTFGDIHSEIQFYRGNGAKFATIGQSNLVSPNSTFDFNHYNGNDFRFVFANTEALRVQASTGNVGIGYHTPFFRLHTLSNARTVAAFSSTQTGNTGNISMLNGASYNYGVIGIVSGNATAQNDVYALGYSPNSNSSFVNVLNWTSTGRVGIGTASPDATLAVNGNIHTEEVRVDVNGAMVGDYVFEEDYNLPALSEIESYVKKNKHLPEVPSAKEFEEKGMNLKEMNLILLKKVEELTLHLIEHERIIKDQQKEITALKKSTN